MLTVMCPLGIRNPIDLIADVILPLDSLIDESHSPVMSNVGIPGDKDISITDLVAVIPSAKHDSTLTTLCLTANLITSCKLIYDEDTVKNPEKSSEKIRKSEKL